MPAILGIQVSTAGGTPPGVAQRQGPCFSSFRGPLRATTFPGSLSGLSFRSGAPGSKDATSVLQSSLGGRPSRSRVPWLRRGSWDIVSGEWG